MQKAMMNLCTTMAKHKYPRLNYLNSRVTLELKLNPNEHIIRAYNCHIQLQSNAKSDDEFVFGNGKAQILVQTNTQLTILLTKQYKLKGKTRVENKLK